MIYYFVLVSFSIIFFELLLLLRISRDAAAIVAHSSDSARTLASKDMKDDEKEVLMRRRSLEIFKATSRLGGKLFLTCLLLYLSFQPLAAKYPDFRRITIESIFSPSAIAVVSVGVACYAWVRKWIAARL